MCSHVGPSAGAQYSTDLWEAKDGREGPARGLNGTFNGTGFEEEYFTRRAAALIAAHGPAGTPFFLFFAGHLLHSPLCAPEALLRRFGFIDNEMRRYVAAMVTAHDDTVGAIADALRACRSRRRAPRPAAWRRRS